MAKPDELSERGLERVLEVASPVPYGLKSPLYEELITDKRWHQTIFRSLLYSGFDYFGDLDISRGRRLLERLDLPEETQGLVELRLGFELSE